jgi:hypothetical protein
VVADLREKEWLPGLAVKRGAATRLLLRSREPAQKQHSVQKQPSAENKLASPPPLYRTTKSSSITLSTSTPSQYVRIQFGVANTSFWKGTCVGVDNLGIASGVGPTRPAEGYLGPTGSARHMTVHGPTRKYSYIVSVL